MALKDWKKVRDESKSKDGSIIFMKGNKQLVVESVIVNMAGVRKWQVELMKGNNGFFGLHDKNFENKAQALKFAKAYMRTH